VIAWKDNEKRVAYVAFRWRELLVDGGCSSAGTERRGSATANFLEFAAELTAIFETKAGGNFLHAEERFVEQLFGVLHFEVENVLFRGKRGLGFEQADKVPTGEVHLGGQVLHRQIAMQPLAPDFYSSLDSAIHPSPIRRDMASFTTWIWDVHQKTTLDAHLALACDNHQLDRRAVARPQQKPRATRDSGVGRRR